MAAIDIKNEERQTDKIGTQYYIAPEVIKKNYGPKCDVWSCGVIAYLILSGQVPFNGLSNVEILDQVLKGEINLS